MANERLTEDRQPISAQQLLELMEPGRDYSAAEPLTTIRNAGYYEGPATNYRVIQNLSMAGSLVERIETSTQERKATVVDWTMDIVRMRRPRRTVAFETNSIFFKRAEDKK